MVHQILKSCAYFMKHQTPCSVNPIIWIINDASSSNRFESSPQFLQIKYTENSFNNLCLKIILFAQKYPDILKRRPIKKFQKKK